CLRHIHSDDPSCRAAVARLNATRVAQGLAPGAPLTGGYGKARQRLVASLFYGLMHQSGQRPALSTSILLDEQLNRRPMTVKFVSGSCRPFLCETASRLDVTTSIHMLKGLRPAAPAAGAPSLAGKRRAGAALAPASSWSGRGLVGRYWQRPWGV